jgi:hypothetical protein
LLTALAGLWGHARTIAEMPAHAASRWREKQG